METLRPDCGSCPRTTEARALHRNAIGVQYCFDCPGSFVSRRFEALAARAEAGRLAIRSCRPV